jgi:hypothetical protein
MNKIAVLAAASVLAASGGIAAARTLPRLGAYTTPGVHLVIPKQGGAVLYSQSPDNSGVSIVSQAFESAYAQYDSQSADDFVVPKGKTWTLFEVDVVGEYYEGSGPATSENVVIYASRKGKPGKVIQTFASVNGRDSSGSFAINLANATPLPAGTYWISVQANLAFSVGGDWGWTSTDNGAHKQAVWENPAAGFGTGCTKYTIETTCIPAGQGPGKVFALKGTSW